MLALRNGVGVFKEQGGTIAYLITRHGMAAADSQFRAPARNRIAGLRKQSDEPFRLLINTCRHSGVAEFQGEGIERGLGAAYDETLSD